MSTFRGDFPLGYHRINRSELGVVASLELDPDQVARFLGPIADIVDAVRRGPAHSLIGIEVAGNLVGFYVVHPDPRDRSSWWLGWLAIDRRQQGRGYGREAVISVMKRLRHVAGCRRIKLLVAPENTQALRLYRKARFRQVGMLASTGELVLEVDQADSPRPGDAAPRALVPGPVTRHGIRFAAVPPTVKPHGPARSRAGPIRIHLYACDHPCIVNW